MSARPPALGIDIAHAIVASAVDVSSGHLPIPGQPPSPALIFHFVDSHGPHITPIVLVLPRRHATDLARQIALATDSAVTASRHARRRPPARPRPAWRGLSPWIWSIAGLATALAPLWATR